jgi:hypothetical protein
MNGLISPLLSNTLVGGGSPLLKAELSATVGLRCIPLTGLAVQLSILYIDILRI